MKSTSTEFSLRLAASPADVAAVQRLRYNVFVQEFGADSDGVDHASRHEKDCFDAFADHLMLCDLGRDAKDNVVGTYRLMSRAQARNAGRFYSETEFDLTAISHYPGEILELGRSCVHPDYRGGTALLHLWRGLGQYVATHGIDLLFGVASFPGSDLKPHLPALSLLQHAHAAPKSLAVKSKDTQPQPKMLAGEELDHRAAMLQMPGLIKSYLRLGGVVGDGVYVDHDFQTTDVFLMLETHRLTARQKAMFGGTLSAA